MGKPPREGTNPLLIGGVIGAIVVALIVVFRLELK